MPSDRSKRSKASRASPIGPFACSTVGCELEFTRKSDLKRHELTHLTGQARIDKSFKCPKDNCTFMTLQRSNYNTHMRTHEGERLVCDAEDCKFTTPDPSSLYRHKTRWHGLEKAGRPKNSSARKGKSVASRPPPASASEPVASSSRIHAPSASIGSGVAVAGVSTSLHPADFSDDEYSSPSGFGGSSGYPSPLSHPSGSSSSAAARSISPLSDNNATVYLAHGLPAITGSTYRNAFQELAGLNTQKTTQHEIPSFDVDAAYAKHWSHASFDTLSGLDVPGFCSQLQEEHPDALYNSIVQNGGMDQNLDVPLTSMLQDFNWNVDQNGWLTFYPQAGQQHWY